MTKILTMLSVLALVACGAAPQTAAPKTTNPPLKRDTKAKKVSPADPSARPSVERDGLTLKFHDLGISLTPPNSNWSPRADGGNLIFGRQGSTLEVIMLFMNPPGVSAKLVAEGHHKAFTKDPSNVAGPVEEERGGRWRFTLEFKTPDGKVIKGQLSVQQIPAKPDHYMVSLIVAPADDYEPTLGEAVSLLESLKALP